VTKQLASIAQLVYFSLVVKESTPTQQYNIFQKHNSMPDHSLQALSKTATTFTQCVDTGQLSLSWHLCSRLDSEKSVTRADVGYTCCWVLIARTLNKSPLSRVSIHRVNIWSAHFAIQHLTRLDLRVGNDFHAEWT